ncbi:MAG: SDR family NAD(P)-dependent oxidoreductase [Clostridia bacterium]|nr:SDR family NAD(P)-dependent oxidoreductase [Clostridia bacterium]
MTDERTNETGRLSGRAVIVTGASRGIGRAIVEALAAEGAAVVGVARDMARLEAVAREVPGFVAHAADVRDGEAARRIVQDTVDRFGSLSAVVMNAGVGYYARVEDLDERHLDEMLGVNLKGPFIWSQAALPFLERQRDGHLVFISSVAGTTTFEGGAGYCASKWGVMALADTLRQEVKPYELRVTVVCPGSVATGFAGAARGYGLDPSDVAHVVVEALAAPKRAIYNTVIMRPMVPPR